MQNLLNMFDETYGMKRQLASCIALPSRHTVYVCAHEDSFEPSQRHELSDVYEGHPSYTSARHQCLIARNGKRRF